MPQINRIRVNNVKYNFGTQSYDDFIMRFSCKNTIYDLANGGGKSLLMLLLMQNLIPNCTLDDKQPLEKLFRKNSGNTVIHSLIEWKLDECYMREQYKYMTTGFCARKASLASEEEGASASVEYFNYCIFYRKFGDNDIRNLPLQENGEKITYNGLKAYLRDLEKKDFGVEVHIFEGKGEYQKFISQYGLYESEWEMIRGINKTEGHVRTYFESNYRTSRKVVEDLLIEEIIQKSFANKMGVESDESMMAKTLMEIKDQLIELSKKRSQMGKFDSQAAAFEGILAKLKEFEDLYVQKESLSEALVGMYAACRKAISIHEQAVQDNIDSFESKNAALMEEHRLVQTAKVMEEEKNYQEICQLSETTNQERLSLEEKKKQLENQLASLEAANDYKDYLDALAKAEQTREMLAGGQKGHQEVLEELNALAYALCTNTDKTRQELENSVKELQEDWENKTRHLKACGQDLEKYRVDVAKAAQSMEMLKSLIQEKEAVLSKKLSGDTVLIPEQCREELDRTREQYREADKEYYRLVTDYEAESDRLDRVRLEMVRAQAYIDSEKKLLDSLQENEDFSEEESRIEDLKNVYREYENEALLDKIAQTCATIDDEIRTRNNTISMLKERSQALEQGTYAFGGAQYKQVKEYLMDTYKEDVVDGISWFASLDTGRKRDLRKRLPFVEYGFIIKNDFDRIISDVRLQEFKNSSYLVPIISENVIYDTKLEINSERIVYGTWNLDFLYDRGKRELLEKTTQEEILTETSLLDKAKAKSAIVWEDYYRVGDYIRRMSGESYAQKIASLQENINKEQENVQKSVENSKKLEENCGELKAATQRQKKLCEDLDKKINALVDIVEYRQEIDRLYSQKEESSGNLAASREQLEKCIQEHEAVAGAVADAASRLASKKAEQEEFRKVYQVYEKYYPKNVADSSRYEGYMQLPYDVCSNRFLGLIQVYERENFDVADKQALMDSYNAAAAKALESIEYRQMTLEQVKEDYDSGRYVACGREELLRIKKQIKEAQDAVYAVAKEYDAQCALKNRIEGSMEHGKGQIIERFGVYETFECQSLGGFIQQHKALIDNLKEELKEFEAKKKSLEGESRKLAIIEKELERIVTDAGCEPDSWQNVTPATGFDNYNEVAKSFSVVLKQEGKLKDGFYKVKSILADVLEDLEAYELAGEVKRSLNVPATREDASATMANIRETIDFIILEKERIKGSIESMEQIKDNFENRCIQTCANIRSQLDRLPKMSTIMMDDERISMIGLTIPYVRNEQIKERMSSYIDETVTGAESFKNPEERLKYIRVRLAWKKLFSVIVSDMNAIKIQLYKRERLKDQSRYLPYEEAVGSTGQSQGIYIQFFIAIIHYISSINAAEGQAQTLGKTIFIDNPFGAAKDVYIWEPIFKLLKTNHVQLIVPARGATPAITGRFDVNYILGQKMVGNRQQTVVVDYHSQVQGEMAEYVKMDYQQVALDLQF